MKEEQCPCCPSVRKDESGWLRLVYLGAVRGLATTEHGQGKHKPRTEDEAPCEDEEVPAETMSPVLPKLGAVPARTARAYGVECGRTKDIVATSEKEEDTRTEGEKRRKIEGARTRRKKPPTYTPLIKAAAKGWSHTVERLVSEERSKVFEKDERGRTALDWAKWLNKKETARKLGEVVEEELEAAKKAEEAAKETYKLERLVERNGHLRAMMTMALYENDVKLAGRAARAADFGRAEFDRAVRVLWAMRGQVKDEDTYFADATSETGSDALMMACAFGDDALAERLLERGARMDRENDRGHTALSWACVCGADKVVMSLLEKGARASRRSAKDGRTPLLHAAEKGHYKVCRVLVDRLFHEAQMHRFEVLRPNKAHSVTEREIECADRAWHRHLESQLEFKDPETGKTALELASEFKTPHAKAVLESAHAMCDQRNAELRYEESHRELVECPRACGASIQRAEVQYHLLNDCDLRPVGCDLCGSSVPERTLYNHRRQECPARVVQCETCTRDVTAAEFDAHVRFRCPKRSVRCRFGCGLTLKAEQQTYHELSRCRFRPRPCPLPGCPEEIPACLVRVHVREQCLHRKVLCSVGCGLEIPVKDLRAHETEICLRGCRWGCGQKIGPTQRREVHETVACHRRGLPCPNGCAVKNVAAEAQPLHAAWVCPLRPTDCEYGCGWRGPLADAETHYAKTCDERQDRCRYDMLGRRIEIRQSSLFDGGSDDVFERVVLMRYDDGKFLVSGQAAPRWLDLAKVPSWVYLDNDDWTCGWIAAADMRAHLESSCSKAPPNVQNKAPIILTPEGPENDDATPEKKHEALTSKALVVATTTKNASSAGVQREKNPKPATRCKYGCGASFPEGTRPKEIEAHVQDACPKRPVECVCGIQDLWAEEVSEHETICPVLTYVPPPKGRTCVCGLYVPDFDRAEHSSVCPKRECFCPYGCGQKHLVTAMESHLGKCARRYLLHGVLVACPLGCGREGMRYQDKWVHAATECPRRVCECDSGCGKQMLYTHLADHFFVCPKRILPCGADAAGCRRSLRSWFSEDVVEDDSESEAGEAVDDDDAGFLSSGVLTKRPLLEKCDIHGATVLHYAVRTQNEILLNHVLERLERESPQEIDVESGDGHTALTKACEMDWLETVDKLWRAGADLTKETRRGRTPLIEAAKSGAARTARFLVDRGAAVDQRSRHRTTAVDWALKAGHETLHRQLQRDLQVHRDTVKLFTLVTLGDVDAVTEIVEPGEPYERGVLARLLNELQEEDAAVENAVSTGRALEDDIRQLQREERASVNTLDASKAEAVAAEGMADAALRLGDSLKSTVDARSRGAAIALERVETADINEVNLLRRDAVPAGVSAVLYAVCELLKAEKTKASKDDDDATLKWKAVKKRVLSTETLARLKFFSTQAAFANDPHLAFKLRKAYGGASSASPAFAEEREPDDEVPIPSSDDKSQEDDSAQEALRQALEMARARTKKASECPDVFDLERDGDRFFVNGYELVGALGAWVNGQVAALEAGPVAKSIERLEAALRSRFYGTRAPALKKAEQGVLLAKNRTKFRRNEREKLAREEAGRRHKVRAWEGKLRVARVLQKYAPTGHSLLTWASALGNARLVETLLDHGACPALPDDVEDFAIKVVQFVWRHHRWRKVFAARDPATVSAAEKADRRMREATFGFLLARQLSLYTDLRKRVRVPLAEAAYNGHETVFEAFKRRRKLTTARALVVSAARPQPPFPFALRPDHGLPREFTQGSIDRRRGSLASVSVFDHADQSTAGSTTSSSLSSSKKKTTRLFTLVDCVELGAIELEHRHWQYGEAWISGNSSSAPREATRIIANNAWGAHYRMVQRGARRQEGRMLHRTQKEKRKRAIDELMAAVGNGDFNRVVDIFDAGAVPVDYEDPSTGITALLGASREERGCFGAVDVEGTPVLAVVLLLDRRKKRPDIDRENRKGRTALVEAVVKGRLDIMAALIDRGADVSKPSKNRHGWTPLRWAVEADKPESVEYLLARGASSDSVADDGLTAHEAAIQGNKFEARAAMARFKRGFVGPAKAPDWPLETPFKKKPCRYGCGATLDDSTETDHVENTCPKRPLVCVECGDLNLWAEEMPAHLLKYCPVARPVKCPLNCGAEFRADQLADHTLICVNKVTVCFMCGVDVRESRIEVHKKYFCEARRRPSTRKPRRIKDVPCEHCMAKVPETKLRPDLHDCPLFRATDCPNKCGQQVQLRDLQTHLAVSCELRWIECTACGRSVRHADLEAHTASPEDTKDAPLIKSGVPRCGVLLEACPDCEEKIPLRQLPLHRRFDCPDRLVPCGLCADEVKQRLIADHKARHCPMRSVECPNQFCYLQLPASAIAAHALNDCRKRLVRCLAGCGAFVRVKSLDAHATKHCPYRFVACPLGCSKKLRAKDEWRHVEHECVRRAATGYAWGTNAADDGRPKYLEGCMSPTGKSSRRHLSRSMEEFDLVALEGD